MKSKAVVCAAMAMSLTTSGLTFAQASNYETRLDEQRQAQAYSGPQPDCRDTRVYHRDRAQGQDRRPVPGAWAQTRGAGPDHNLREGQLLPRQFRSRQFVVDDWRRHLLCPPPSGYQWVQMGTDYVLVAIATGVILQLLLNN